jgi:LAO/AO transport system kinase
MPPDTGRWSDVTQLISAVRHADPRAVGRLITLAEEGSPLLKQISAELVPATTATTLVVGVTGAPGVGKSTLTASLIAEYRQRGQAVGVLAVDPSSPLSGGAVLGDRVRMQQHATDPGVFIRSMASRGHLGGLAVSVPQALRILATAGYGVVLIETVGVGQSEVEVAAVADTTVVLLAPGMGDGIQAAKAGILEVADIFVVNKADRDGVDITVRQLRGMLSWGKAHSPDEWCPPIVKSVATRGEGVAELVAAVDRHVEWLIHTGQSDRRLFP